MAAPPWGGDFGAALAGAPGFALLAWLLLGRRVRARSVVLLGVILVGAGLLVGIVDVLRPKAQQTHVGRFVDRITNDGFEGFALVIKRKALDNIHSLTTTRLLWLLPIGAVVLVYLWWTRRTDVRSLVRDQSVVRSTLVAFALTAFLGYALNDSGIAIPALMVLVLECTAAFVVAADLDRSVRTDVSVPETRAEPSYAGSRERS
jgi:hypothetical protein